DVLGVVVIAEQKKASGKHVHLQERNALPAQPGNAEVDDQQQPCQGMAPLREEARHFAGVNPVALAALTDRGLRLVLAEPQRIIHRGTDLLQSIHARPPAVSGDRTRLEARETWDRTTAPDTGAASAPP